MGKTVKDHILKVKLGTIAVVTALAFSTLIGVGIGYEKIQARLRHLDAKTSLYQTQFDNLENRVDKNDIEFAEIQKDLSAIQVMLVEIKQKLH